MTVTKAEVRSGTYYDSVVLMQLQRSLGSLPGILDAGVVMCTDANKAVLAHSNLLTPEAQDAMADDLVIVVRAEDDSAAQAALAQVEGSGNPLARTYWRWQLTWNPLEWYQPASSAVGMYQITDGTFREAARYCIHDHEVVEEGPWHDPRSCWFNVFYTRLLPNHAIELTAALLDRHVAKAIESRRPDAVTLEQKQNLAAVIHLCGFGTGRTYAARRFRLTPHQRCGDHDVRTYLARIKALKHTFAKISKEAKSNR